MDRDPPPVPLERLLAHRAWVRRVAVAVVGSGEGADDVEQEVWLAALRAGPREEGAARAWLRTALRRAASRLRRGEARRRAREEAVAPRERDRAQPAPAEVLAAAEAHRRVVEAVLALEEPSRTAVVLRYFEGLPPEALAARLGVPLETVRTRLRRGLARLREELGGNDDGGARRALAPLLEVPPGATAPPRSGAATAAATGGVLVGKAATVAAAGALLLLAAGWWWNRPGDGVVGGSPAPPAGPGGPVARGPGGPSVTMHPGAERADSPAASDAAPAPEDPRDPARRSWLALTGRVTDADGAPVEGARVSVSGPAIDGIARREAVCAVDGGYGLVGIPPEWRTEARALIEVRAPGFGPLLVPATGSGWGGGEPLPGGGARGEQDFVLVEPAAVRGRVLREEDDSPVGGARVVAWWESPGQFRPGEMLAEDDGPRRLVLGEACSAADGTFHLVGLPARGLHEAVGVRIGAVAEGRAVGVLHFADARPGRLQERDLLLVRAGAVEGRVLRADRRPAAGACVAVYSRAAVVPALPPAAGLLATTGPDGRYRIDGVPAPERGGGAAQASLVAALPTPGVEGRPPRAVATVEVRGGAIVAVPDIVLLERPVLSAIVLVRDEAGAPVEGATVGRLGRTGADGRFLYRWSLPPPERLELDVGAPGFARGVVSVVLAVDPSEFVVTLPPPAIVEGRVLDAEGAPVAGAAVECFDGSVAPGSLVDAAGQEGEEDPAGPIRAGETDGDGGFRWEDLPAGEYTVRARARAARMFVNRAGPPSPFVVARCVTGTPLDLRLPWTPPPPLEGEVFDAATGRPLRASFTVTLGADGVQVWATSRGPGRFRFECYPRGAWTLQVRATGYADAEPIPIDLSGNAPLPAVRVDLVPLPSTGRGVGVRGTLTAPADRMLAGAYVHLSPRGPPAAYQKNASGVIDSRGRFMLHEVRPGPYALTVTGAGPGDLAVAGNVRVEVPEGASPPPVELPLVPGGTLFVRVKGPVAAAPGTGPPDSRTDPRVRVRDGAGAVVEEGVVSRVAGAWHLFRLAPGRYVVRLEDGEAVVREEAVVLAGGDGAVAEW